MNQRLSNKIAFITGGSSGIGLAAAKTFANEGADVVVLARDQQKADQAVAEIGHRCSAVIGDVTDLAALQACYQSIAERHGRLDIVFASAGIGTATPFGDIDANSFDRIVDINFKGTFFTVRYALPLLAPGASVVLVASCLNEMGMADYSVYSATKAAVRSLARSLTPDLARISARINVLSPGPIDTPVLEKAGLSSEQIDAVHDAFSSVLAAGRMGRPEEMARAALFLASDDSTYLYGSEIQADGGMNQVRWPRS